MLKKILIISVTFLGLFSLATSVFAQSDEELAKKYGITFPITELGNCVNVASCKTFCNDPKNQQSCTDFAKKHKLSSTSTKTSQKSDEEIFKFARTELGCSSYDACMEFCEQEVNMEKCMDFAARHNLMEDATQMKQQMSALKNLLGCTSMKACMDFCNNPNNIQKCMEVFKQAGFSVEASYSGPGGCNSEESCRMYCEKNPKECGGDNFQQEPPEVWCNKVSTDCKWDGKTCTCGGQAPPQESGEIWCPKAGPNCKWTGTNCNCYDQHINQEGTPLGVDPTQWCNQNPGKCTYQNSGDEKVDFSSQCLSQTGCTWDTTTKICSCQTQTSPSCPQGQIMESNGSCRPEGISTEGGETITESQCLSASCNWTETTCRCPDSKGVQGASTNRSLLQQILDFILGR